MSETKERRKAPKMKTANILGTIYRIEYAKSTEDSVIGKEGDAYCDWTGKKIVLQDPEDADGNLADMDAYWRKTLRHEILHAFLFESGLAQNSFQTDAWAQNEEMIDWLAFMGPKIINAWEEAGCL